MKWLLDVKLLEFFGDFRFAISVYNVPEDFIFRTRDEESCREWVATLNSAKEARSTTIKTQKASEAAAETPFPDLLDQQNHDNSSNQIFPDLDMHSGELGPPPPSAPPMEHMDHSPNINGNGSNHSRSSSVGSGSNSNSGAAAAAATQPTKERLSIKELRAIAHGAGYDTRGMERSDLEKIAAYYAPVSEKNVQYNQQQQQPQQQQQQSHKKRMQNAQDELEKRKKAEAAERARKEKEDERIREQQKYVQQMREEARKREEEAKAQLEARKRDAEMKRRQQNWHQGQTQQAQQPPQQKQWKKPNNSCHSAAKAESTPRRPGPGQVFESVRFSTGESGPRRKNAFPSHQQHQQFSAQSQQYARPPDPPAASASIPHPPPPQQQTPQSPPPPPNNSNPRSTDPTSPLNQKYAKAMAANQSNPSAQDEQTIITNIKRNILITWALVPPQYNMLRPIDQLLASIQTVFPPFTGVATNEYFEKWKAINHQDLLIGVTMGGADETKLIKAVRKLRVFLHPDRLPREFDAKQTFVCKMLWDVSNDAYEEFKKHKEDLDWVGS